MVLKFKNKWLLISIFLLLLILSFNFPLVGDDWGRVRAPLNSISDFFNIIQSQWLYLNGRVIGNISSILLIQNRILRSFVFAVTILSIVLLIYKIVKEKKENKIVLLLFTCICVIFIPKEIFKQVYAWGAGFCNYVPSIVGLLYYFWIQENHAQIDKRKSLYKALTFIAVFCSCLFSENLTLYILIMSIATSGYAYWKIRKLNSYQISGILGAITGSLTMFLSPVYGIILNNGDAYRGAGFSLEHLFETARKNFPTVCNYTIGNNYFMMFILSGLLFYFLYKTNLNSKSFKKIKPLAHMILVLVPCYFYSINKVLYNDFFNLNPSDMQLWLTVFVLVIYYSTWVYIVIHVDFNEKIKVRLLFLMISILILNGPLLFITPIGPRVFYASYIVLCLMAVSLFNHLVVDQGIFKIPFSVLLFTVNFCFIFIYAENHRIEKIQATYIKEQMALKEKTIRLPYFTYNTWLHEPHDGKIGNTYYYSEKKDIEFEYIKYKEWQKIAKK